MTDLANQEYLRQRLEPRPGDLLYLHLSDLLLAVKAMVPVGAARVLDYGCGGSPYRPLFGNCSYHRADLPGTQGLDFEFDGESRLPPEARDYDCVLSSQVLEHVKNPQAYLQECHRVLKPNGCLLLTTHGLYEDHACPEDYWRWTAFGLQRQVEAAGLQVHTMKKLTTGPRGALFLAERELSRLRLKKAGWYGLYASMGIRLLQRIGAAGRHKGSDASFPDHRVVDVSESGHDIYVALAVLARKAVL